MNKDLILKYKPPSSPACEKHQMAFSHLDVAHAKLPFYTGQFFSGTKWTEVTELPWARNRRAHGSLKQTSLSPVFCWFKAPAQHWPAARPLIPDWADITHSLQFPPKETEMVNIIAHNFLPSWCGACETRGDVLVQGCSMGIKHHFQIL